MMKEAGEGMKKKATGQDQLSLMSEIFQVMSKAMGAGGGGGGVHGWAFPSGWPGKPSKGRFRLTGFYDVLP